MNRRKKEQERERKRISRNYAVINSTTGTTHPYSPQQLSLLVGNANTEIPDDIIQVALNLMKAHSEQSTSPYIGYFTPAELSFICSNPEIPHRRPLPDHTFSINIHPLQNHWVTSSYDNSTGNINVYDSQMTSAHLKQVLPQIEIVYGEAKAQHVKYVTVTQQSAEPICGVMAIAYAFSCFLKNDPALINYDITSARQHLKLCISTGQVAPFPVIQQEPRNNYPSTELMDNYFADQNTKAIFHKIHVTKKSTQTTFKSRILATSLPMVHHNKRQKVNRQQTAELEKETNQKKSQLHKTQKKDQLHKTQKKDQLHKTQKKERLHKTQLLSEMHDLKTSISKDYQNTRQALYRQQRTQLKKDSDRKKDQVRKRITLIHKNSTEKDATKQKNTLQKKTLRQQKLLAQKNCNNMKDKTKKQDSKDKRKKPGVEEPIGQKPHVGSTDINQAISSFKDAISNGPTYSCFSCCRYLYRTSVTHFNTKRLMHEMKTSLFPNQPIPSPSAENIWICKQCNSSFKKNQVPPISTANSLSLEIIPKELDCLTSLELQLISKILPFMKIIAKPTGAQTAIKGQVVLVPADISKVTTSLPRPTTHSQIITLALKRRLCDKHSFHQQFIRPQNVNTALQYLKAHSPFYVDVTVNETWENFTTQQTPEFTLPSALQQQNKCSDFSKEDPNVRNDDPILDSEDEVDETNPPEIVELLRQKASINSNTTCIRPFCGPEVSTKDVLNLAPAEGQRPIPPYKEPNWEAMAFPNLFPSGKNTLNTERKMKISRKKYFKARLLHKDGRFAESSEYIFQVLDFLEREELQSNITITSRKSYHQDITAGQLKDPNRLQRLINDDQVFASFKNIRGTPQYWQQMQLDMLAKLRQLGPYTFFITGSAAEFHWPQVIKIVAKQYGTDLSTEEVNSMDWNTKRMWLQRNPVTVARQIDFVFEQLWNKVILSGSHPIGQILNYDRRKEMQGRGTEHFHAAIHVKDAPKLDEQTDEQCITFIDKYISCQIPNKEEDEELFQLVKTRQVHHHTKTCKKNKNKSCRFGYPRSPSPFTLIARPPDNEDAACIKQRAMKIQGKVYQALLKSDLNTPLTLDTILNNAQITESDYIAALKTAQRRTTIILKRDPSETKVNNYNSHILRALGANMDIQFITNIWACIAYLTSYMCKPERSMSELMRKASKEAANKNIQDALKDIGAIFIKAREVSEHEAISRILSLPLRRSNIDVAFIQTDLKENRTRLLKSKKSLKSLHNDDPDIYLPSIHEKYACRPNSLNNLPLAEFVANYTITSKSQNQQDDDNSEKEEIDEPQDKLHQHKLKNNMGTIRKRKHPQVIRYHYISKERDEELYYHRLLLLYLPWRHESDLLEGHSYKTKFEHVKKDTNILENIKIYEPYNDEVESILENFDPQDAAPEMWNEMAAQYAQEQQESQINSGHILNPLLDPDSLSHIEDKKKQEPTSSTTRTAFTISTIHLSPDQTFLKMVRNLNVQQKKLFDFMLQWATQTRLAPQITACPDPFYIFLSGSGGVGKTYTINTLYEGLVRALRTPGQDPAKPTVLMTASTGKAASNINGTTLHSAFALPIRETLHKFVYKKPNMEKLNTLRCLYVNLKVIIADEISMFGSSSLNHLSCTLQEIFQNYSKPFGGISILAVGDLLQLNPVGDRPVFKPAKRGYEALAGSLWTNFFKLYELTTIIRQKGDPSFAQMLSHIRLGQTTDADKAALESLQYTNTDQFPKDTVHLYLTNKQVDEYNREKLSELPQPHITIKANDTRKDLHTNSTEITVQCNNIHKTGGLPESLTLAEGARWMLTKNIDISDHLVNGVIGTIAHLDLPPEDPLNETIYIKFDSNIIGSKAKKSSPKHLCQAVPIKAITVKFLLAHKSNVPVERRMFPGTLAFALTAHKAQGSTYEYMIADFQKTPGYKTIPQGLAYTMLSRATSSKNLKLLNFTPSSITVNESALLEINRMRSESLFNCDNPLDHLKSETNLCHLNIRSLNAHITDLQQEITIQHCAIICLTETHVQNQLDHHYLNGFRMLSNPTQHGLAIYVKNTADYDLIMFPLGTSIQIMGITLKTSTLGHIPIIVTYKPPQHQPQTYLHNLEKATQPILKAFQNIVILGDFNMIPENPHFLDFLRRHQLKQLVTSPTHTLGATLDFIITSVPVQQVTVKPVPFSDHHIVCATLDTHN